MFSWSHACSIAFHAMAVLARQDSPAALSAQVLAAELDVSADHLSKVMQRLSKCGLVNSARGPSGGYTLAKDPAAISMLDIYECMEGPGSSAHCVFDQRRCAGGSCIFGGMLTDMNTLLSGYMKKTNLSDHISQPFPSKPDPT